LAADSGERERDGSRIFVIRVGSREFGIEIVFVDHKIEERPGQRKTTRVAKVICISAIDWLNDPSWRDKA
jgi:hypothetical protein